MAAYLIDHPPARQQFYKTRNRQLTGCTVLHTAESVMDTVGPDTGAEAVADFIRARSTPGSYHDLADSDSYLTVVPYESGAFHDGTGSNNWALSISFACRTSDWRAMAAARRDGFLRQGARAFAAQQAYRRSVGAPLTELRLISKAQSDAGMSGFTYHGLRDPGRRTDPGVAPPNLFPFDEFIEHCRAALSGTPLTPSLGDDMSVAIAVGQNKTCWIDDGTKVWWTADINEVGALCKLWGIEPVPMLDAEIQKVITFRSRRKAEYESNLAAAVSAALPGPTLTAEQVAVMTDELAAKLAPSIGDATPLSDADLERIAAATVGMAAGRLAS